MIVFITGGAKNGKSSLAQDLAVQLSRGGRHYYIATMIPSDEEDRERIRRHVADRDGMGFETLECGRNILSCLEEADPSGTFLLDSITALFLNELLPDPTSCEMDLTAADRCERALEKLCRSVANIVVVSDYIYSDAARYDAVTDQYRRGLARLDRRMAAISDTVLEVCGGNILVHKGEMPV